jgi:hypothetical protein
VGNPIRQEVLRALQKWWDERHSRGAAPPGVPTGEKEARTVRTSTPARTTAAPRATVPGVAAAPRAPPQPSWAQRAAEAAAYPEAGMQRVGKKGKPVKEPTGLERIQGSIPPDERRILFERAAGAPQINARVVTSAAVLVNVALSKVAPAHVRTETFRISDRGTLSTTARIGASAAMLLRFKKVIIEAARKADDTIINVIACESWVELKILVPYALYREENGLDDLREAIEAENQGVVIPPFSMKWMRAWRHNEEQWQNGTLPRGRASVIFKVPNKTAGLGLLKEIWVAGNRFQADLYVASRADSLCTICSRWGHSEFRCHSRIPACAICAGAHRMTEHRCEVVTCGRIGRACVHVRVKCPNCAGAHLAQDGRCGAKIAAIDLARQRGWQGKEEGLLTGSQQAGEQHRMRAGSVPSRQPGNWTRIEEEIAAAVTADNTTVAATPTVAGSATAENAAAVNAAAVNTATVNATAENAAAESDTEMTASGIAPPMTL